MMFGVLLSYVSNYHSDSLHRFVEKHRYLLATVVVVGILAVKVPRSREWMHIGGFTLLYLSFGSLLLVFCCNPTRKTLPYLFLKPFAWIGQFSYSIYLWHQFVGLWVNSFLSHYNHPGGFWVAFTLYIAVSLAIGVVLSKLIEFPVLTLRDRLFPSRGSTATVEVVSSSIPRSS